MNISEFRQLYPQYRGFSDDTIARKIHAKHYAGVDYDEFATRFGVKKAPAQQIRPEAEALTAAQRRIAVEPREPGYVPEFAPVEPATLPTRPLTSREIYLGDLKQIYREPGTIEQREEKARVRTKERLWERTDEIQTMAQDPVTRRRIQENNQNLKDKFLAKTYRRWERGEVMVAGGGLYLLNTLSNLSPLRTFPGMKESRETISEWARLMHRAMQEPEMQPVIENTFDKYFGGAVETGPFLGAAIGSAALTSGTSIPASVAGFLVAFGVEGNNILQTNLDQGRSERESRVRAFVGGIINGGIEVAGGGGTKYLKAAQLSTLKKLGKVRYFGKRVLHTALTEGLREEIPQELVGMILGGDPPRNPDGSIDYAATAMRLIDAGIMGTMIGGIADVPFSAYGTAKLPPLPKGDVINIGSGRIAVPGVVQAEANIISEESGNALNPWIKQDVTASNKGRTLVVQSIEDEDISWIGEVNNTVPKTDVYLVKDITEAKAFLAKSGYDHIMFNATDVTKEGVKELAKDFKGEVSIHSIHPDKPVSKTYYHVTPMGNAKSIKEKGLKSGSYITDSLEDAEAMRDFIVDYDETQATIIKTELVPEQINKLTIDESQPNAFLTHETIQVISKPIMVSPTDLKFFADLDNTKTYKAVQAMVEDRGFEYKPGTDLSHFESTQPDPIEGEIRAEAQTADEAIGAQLGLTPTQVQDKLAKAEDRYRLLKHKDTDKRSKADRDELAFLSRYRGDIEAIVNDYTSDKPVIRGLWKKPKKPSKKELLRKGHQIPEQLKIGDEHRRDLQELVTGKRTMAEMSKDQMIEWVKFLETELAARGEVYEERPEIFPQLIESLTTAAKIPVGKIRRYFRESRLGGLWSDLRRIERWLEALDGYEEGPLYRHIWKRVKRADELRSVNIGREQTEFFRIIEDQNIDSAIWCGHKETIREGLELTPFEQIGVYLLDQNEQGHKYLTKSMAITDEDVELISNKLTEEQLVVAAWLDEQYQAQWSVVRAAAIEAGVDPKLLEQELNYSPILRTDLEDDVDFVSLLTEQFNQQSLKPEKGFLEKRKERALGKIQLDAGVIYMKNIQRIETFKAMAPISKDLGRIFHNPIFKKALNEATDEHGVKIMNTWLKDTIRGFMPGPQTEHAKLISIMRRNGIVYAIGFNVPSVMRQTLSLNNAIALDPLMLKYVPANLFEATKGNYKAMEEFVEERSALVRTREYDRDLRKMWNITALAKRLAGKTPWSELATSWIRWTDKRTVVIAWKSLYDVGLEKGMNEQEAVNFADQGITRTQPMANMKDLPHFFRGGTIERLLSTFQNQVNNNLNFYIHDIIGERIAGKISNTEVAYRVMWSYIMPAILFGIIGRGRLPFKKEDDRWTLDLLALGVDLTTYPIATLMLAGRLITRMIRGWGNSGTVGEIAPEEAVRLAQAARRGDISGMIKHAAATYGAATGRIPAQAIRTVGGAMDLAAGTTKDPRRLIYTQWALDQERAKQPETRKPRRGPAGKRSTGRR